MRALVLALTLAPYLILAVKDGAFHMGKKRLRDVSLAEHLIHFVIVAPLAWAISGVFNEDALACSVGLLGFIAPALADELIWHRKIPERETNIHAKEHLALLVFFIVGAVTWLDDAGVARLPWRLHA